MTEDHSYDDIINQPHHTSRKRKQMSLYNRAAQFAPFAALTGHGEAIRKTAEDVADSYEKEAPIPEDPHYI